MRTPFPAIRMMAVLALTLIAIAGAGIPALLWGTVRFALSSSNPTLSTLDGRIAGARILGQLLTGSEYFQLAPSPGTMAWDPATTTGSHIDTTSEKLLEEVRELLVGYLAESGLASGMRLPASLTLSDPNVDSHVSLDDALQQVERIARSRGLSVDAVRGLIEVNAESRNRSALGAAAVNVLMLNLALDSLTASRLR